MIKKMKRVFLMMAVSCLFTGCRMAALPGQEPFGEQTTTGFLFVPEWERKASKEISA